MRKTIVLLAGFLLYGCAINSGVVPVGQNTFMVSRQAATGFLGMADLKAKAITEANQFCANQEKSLQVISTNESQPPYILANYPRVEVQFKCLDGPPLP